MNLYDYMDAPTWEELICRLKDYEKHYEMDFKVLNFQETPGRFIAFIEYKDYTKKEGN